MFGVACFGDRDVADEEELEEEYGRDPGSEGTQFCMAPTWKPACTDVACFDEPTQDTWVLRTFGMTQSQGRALRHRATVARVVVVGSETSRVVDRWVLRDSTKGSSSVRATGSRESEGRSQYRHTNVRLMTRSFTLNIVLNEFKAEAAMLGSTRPIHRNREDALSAFVKNCSGAVVVVDPAEDDDAALWSAYFGDLPTVLVVPNLDTHLEDRFVRRLDATCRRWFALGTRETADDLEPLAFLGSAIATRRDDGLERTTRAQAKARLLSRRASPRKTY
ncbi:hypothetical protein CTAYLR_000048 [Chrysophaeum taylorii]|uniref:Uncharacterized protein n=1 Tax=Chrysophaeum taylorii TaxID=2483200 RepID=A0AAD7UI55_9STRA|nr:hypothetical protein CTAYLR_000048 [Chrysophaeum taylorii]